MSIKNIKCPAPNLILYQAPAHQSLGNILEEEAQKIKELVDGKKCYQENKQKERSWSWEGDVWQGHWGDKCRK